MEAVNKGKTFEKKVALSFNSRHEKAYEKILNYQNKIMRVLSEFRDGLNRTEISQRVNLTVWQCQKGLKKLEASKKIIGVRKGSSHKDKKYYVRQKTYKL